MSLTSTIRDWCDTIDSDAFEYLFSDGTDKCLSLFKNISNDENAFIAALARLATGLRVEDWDSSKINIFEKNLLDTKRAQRSTKIDTETNNLYQ